MRFPGKAERIRIFVALAVGLPCAGCWEEIHYQPPTATTAEAEDAEAAETTPSGDELFAGDPDAPAPPRTEPAPIVVPPTPVESPVVAPAPVVAAPTPVERLAAWTLASDWSLVAAMRANQIAASRYETYLAAARDAGDSLGIAAPQLPSEDSSEKLVEDVIAELQTGAGPRLADAIETRLDAAAGAAARLAMRAHLLLLTYTPAGSAVWSDAADIRDAGVASGLPPELWRPLVELLERRADFVEVRKAVFDLRKAIPAHLAE